MEQPVCPSCRASLDDERVASGGVAQCPFCGADLLEVAGEAGAAVSSRDSIAPQPEATGADWELPKSSGVRVVEASDARKVISIPAGGKRTRFLGLFALMWNGFMIVFTPPWFFAGGDVPLLFIVPFLGLFWAVGLGMLLLWIKMRFTRMYLLLEADRLVIQRILFGRKSVALVAR